MKDIAYSGELSAAVIEVLGAELRKEMNGTPTQVSDSVFSVFVELMNNMLMYSRSETSGEDCLPHGSFNLTLKDGVYRVQSINLMKSKNTQLVKDRIDYLNSLDRQSLRSFYKERIKGKNTNPESKGGGVGLIEIAKRASAQIEYKFTPRDNQLTTLTIEVTINC